MRTTILAILLLLPALAEDTAQSIATVTYDNQPGGTLDKPLILRTYVPSMGLSDEVLSNHDDAAPSPRYSPKRKREDPNKSYQPIDGIPASIAVNHGPHLSYVWDTTECRLLYAWEGGFLDMTKYWGTEENGRRIGFGYIPKLVGTLTYLAQGNHPIRAKEESVTKPVYLGYKIEESMPVFEWQFAGTRMETKIIPTETNGAFRIEIKSPDKTPLIYRLQPHQIQLSKDTNLSIVLTNVNPSLANKNNTQEKTYTGVTLERGEHLYIKYSCQMCHTTDGGKSHGPTLKDLAGRKRDFGGTSVVADDAYLYESIIEPNAKVVPGFPPNYMPKFPLKKEEVDSLVLYLKTFTNHHD